MLRCGSGRFARGADPGAVLAGACASASAMCAFERLEGELELVGVELLGLLAVHRAAQLAQEMFETPVVLSQRSHPAAQALDHRFGFV